MAAARLFSKKRRVCDQSRGLHHVGLFRGAYRKPLLYGIQQGQALAQSDSRTGDARVVPHDAPDVISGDLGGSAIDERRSVPFPCPGSTLERGPGDHVACDTLREHQALEQRVRCQPVGAVYPGTRDLAAGVESLEARAATQVGDNTSHHVVSRRNDGNQVFCWIDSTRATQCKNSGEPPSERRAELPCIEPDAASPRALAENLP